MLYLSLSVVSGAVPLRSCWGPLVARRGPSHTHDVRARDKLCGMLGVAGRNTIQAGE
jgi:hypothetical protein